MSAVAVLTGMAATFSEIARNIDKTTEMLKKMVVAMSTAIALAPTETTEN